MGDAFSIAIGAGLLLASLWFIYSSIKKQVSGEGCSGCSGCRHAGSCSAYKPK